MQQNTKCKHHRFHKSKGFGFVTMSTEEEAQKAVSELNGKEIDGRPVNVSEAREEKKEF